jgi:hypothetical protein
MRNISLQIASATQEAPDWSALIAEVKEVLPDSAQITSGFGGEIGEMIQEAIEDAMSTVQMPTAMDHIAGFASMFLQQKMMAQVPPGIAEGLSALNEHATESFTHGPPQE